MEESGLSVEQEVAKHVVDLLTSQKCVLCGEGVKEGVCEECTTIFKNLKKQEMVRLEKVERERWALRRRRERERRERQRLEERIIIQQRPLSLQDHVWILSKIILEVCGYIVLIFVVLVLLTALAPWLGR